MTLRKTMGHDSIKYIRVKIRITRLKKSIFTSPPYSAKSGFFDVFFQVFICEILLFKIISFHSNNQHNFTEFERSNLIYHGLSVTWFEWITNFSYCVEVSTLAYSQFRSFCSQFHKLKSGIDFPPKWNWLRAKVESNINESGIHCNFQRTPLKVEMSWRDWLNSVGSEKQCTHFCTLARYVSGIQNRLQRNPLKNSEIHV